MNWKENSSVQSERPLVIIAGPTASGKSACAVELCRLIGGAVISGDSMQCYRHMDIGTAKTTPAEQKGVPHALIDCLEPEEPWNVVLFQQMARQAYERFYGQGLIPVLAGGTGFYIRAFLYGTDFTQTAEDTAYRKELEEFAKKNGASALHRMLAEADPVSAGKIHENNIKRVIRALEYYAQTGQPISSHNEEQKKKEPEYDAVRFLMDPDRKLLYEAIDRRVDIMFENGLVKEVENLKKKGFDRSFQSMQGIGYKEILDHLDGKCTLDEAAAKIKSSSRHYAKRQQTWFYAEKDWIRIDPAGFSGAEEIAEYMAGIVRKAILKG